MTNTTKRKVIRLDHCQFLLSSHTNYTLTYFAEHSEHFSHDAINRYLLEDRIPPRLVWENVRGQVVTSPNVFVIFDDMVLDKANRRKSNWCASNGVAMPSSHPRHRCGDLCMRHPRNLPVLDY